MVTLTGGSIILVTFPFSDLSQSKLRPAIVLANAGNQDWVLCQITSNSYADTSAIEIREANFTNGSLRLTSYVRPGKLFTANRGLISRKIGDLKQDKFRQIIKAVVDLLMNDTQNTEKPK
ncbi:MAG: type II toxin-antitoxin system PemK/MazF family toxin [Synechocystis sp.]|jgi:mRNA interferase MazF